MSNKVDWSRPIQTRDGRAVKYLGEIIGNWPRVGAIDSGDGYEYVRICNDSGVHGSADEQIINVPERIERWVNVHETHFTDLFESQERAINCRYKKDLWGTVKLTIEDGKLVKAEVEE